MSTATQRPPQTSTGLVRQTPQTLDVPREPILDPDRFAQVLGALQQKAHVLAPAIQISSLAPQHAINLSVVYINPGVNDDGIGNQVYRDKARMKPDERSLNKIGLLQIMQAAGISAIPELCRRTDDGTQRNYWSYYWVGEYLAYDGKHEKIEAPAECDLRDGSAEIGEWTPERWRQELAAWEERKKRNPQEKYPSINGWSERRVLERRRKGLELCETFAMERAIRKLGLKHVYSVTELQIPFVIPRVAIQLDPKDPHTKQMLAERALGSTRTLYPGRALPSSVAVEDPPHTIDIDPVKEPTPELSGAAGPADDVEELPPAQASEPPAVVHIVRSVAKQQQPDGSALYFIRTDHTGDDLGRAFLTTDEGVREAAVRAKREGTPLVIEADAQRHILELQPAKGAAAAGEAASVQLPENARFIAAVESKSGTNARTGKNWTRYSIIATTGESFTTFSKSLADLAEEAKRTNMPVLVTLEDNEQYPDTLKSLSLFDTRQQGLPLSGDKL